MTQKQFMEAVVNSNVNEEAKAYAQKWLDNDHEKSSAKEVERAALLAKALEVLAEAEEGMTATQVGGAIGASTQMASYLLRTANGEGTVQRKKEGDKPFVYFVE